jgi:hypothetical protein
MGAASSFKNRIENHSNGITDLPGVDHMGDLTPFQNQVLDAAQRKEAEEKERKREEARNNSGGGGQPSRPRNSRAGGGDGMGGEETVRYVNESEQPDHEIHDN